MKYANYKFNAKKINNLGDQMQIIAIDRLYKEIGVKNDEIVYLDYHQLKDYSGEYVVLPVTMPMVDYYPNGFASRFSDHIIPVFLGLTMVKQTLTNDEINYLKNYEPIGCRDEYTLSTMRKYGIVSYLHGCITVTLPQRKVDEADEIFIVDVDDQFLKYIPEELLKNARFRTHHREGISNPKEEAQKQYDEYLTKARLVITSLLHCAVPCLAAGIPVILLRNKVTYRMSWLEKILPIYTLEQIDDVDWQASAIDIEDHKKIVLELSINRIKDTKERYEKLLDLSYFYENRKKQTYVNDACEPLVTYIKNNWKDKQYNYKYSIWGLHQTAEWIVEFIKTEYPNAQLCHVYDSFRKMEFNGIISEAPANIAFYKDETIFVTVKGAQNQAKELFTKIGLSEKQYALFDIGK